MEESELRLRVLNRLGLRIGPEMSKYILRKLAESDGPIAIIGGDARTGEAQTKVVDSRELMS